MEAAGRYVVLELLRSSSELNTANHQPTNAQPTNAKRHARSIHDCARHGVAVFGGLEEGAEGGGTVQVGTVYRRYPRYLLFRVIIYWYICVGQSKGSREPFVLGGLEEVVEGGGTVQVEISDHMPG